MLLNLCHRVFNTDYMVTTKIKDLEVQKDIEWRYTADLVDYETALSTMETRVADIISGKALELIWSLEHPPIYTSGSSSKKEDLLQPDRFPVYNVGRGGQYTYHGPGQRVVYLMLNLKKRQPDLRKFVKDIELWVIKSLNQFGLDAKTYEDRIGVWVNSGTSKAKIAAVGIRVKHWITFHGFSINVNPNLEHFSGIIPCGISDFGVTSIEQLGVNCNMTDLDVVLKKNFPLY